MANHSSIEWTESTWNPLTGCTKIGPIEHVVGGNELRVLPGPDALLSGTEDERAAISEYRIRDEIDGFKMAGRPPGLAARERYRCSRVRRIRSDDRMIKRRAAYERAWSCSSPAKLAREMKALQLMAA